MHIKRQNIGKFWPVERKGTKYLAVSRYNKRESIPLVVVMRNIFKLVRNKKELKKIISEKQIMVNNKVVRDTNFPICLFDIISLPELKKKYRAILSENKKMIFNEVSGKESDEKVFRVISKKKLKGNKIQINCSDGRNFLTNEKINIDDSILYNFKHNKIEKIIKMAKGKNAYITKGRYIGDKGVIDSIFDRGGKKLVKIVRDKDNNKINVWIKNLIVME